MSEPIRDAEALGRIVYDADWQGARVTPWADFTQLGKDHYTAIGEAVRRAVCPPDHVVVPRAEHDALLKAVDATLQCWIDDDVEAWVRGPLLRAFAAYQAALGTEATDGD